VALKAYEAYYNSLAQSPSEEYKDKLQAFINSKFDVASSYYTIEEESSSTPNSYVNTDVRINHMINIDTGVRLGDDWRELIFKDFDHVRNIGKKYRFDNFIWLTINSDTYKYPTASTNIRRCNWTLKWYNDDGVLVQEPCIVDYVKMIGSAMGNIDARQTREGNYERFVYLSRTSETLQLKRDKRFFIDNLVFRITKIDSIGHYGLIELSLEEHQVNVETDDVANGIADYYIRKPVDNSNTGTTEILEGSSTIATGANAVWTIYKKVNGIVQSDAYSFSIIGSGVSINTSTSNSVSLKAGSVKGTTFTLRATNLTTSNIIDKIITITGMW